MTMRGRRSKHRKPLLDDGNYAPDELRPLMAKHLEWMAVKQYSALSVHYSEVYLRYLAEWCEDRNVRKLVDVSRDLLMRYERHVFLSQKKNGGELATSTRTARLQAVRSFFKWAARHNLVLVNPAAELEVPKREKGLPKVVPTPEEMERILAEPDANTPLGLRDRTILEVLYSTGMRRMELGGLMLGSIDAENRTVMIRKGKGKKDRVVPIGERALAWLTKYLADVRPTIAVEPGNRSLFLSAVGGVLGLDEISRLVARYIRSSGVANAGACHAFRHAMATAMLTNGADLRCIQEILGHESLQTTQLYTRISIERLKKVHEATHPTSKMETQEAPEPDPKPASKP